MTSETINWTTVICTLIGAGFPSLVAFLKGPQIWEAYKDWQREKRQHKQDLITRLMAEIDDLKKRVGQLEGEREEQRRLKHDALEKQQALQLQLDERDHDLAECRERLRRTTGAME